jgi:hypothetical protein
VTISENVLVEDSLRATPQGFEVEVLINWYRSLPLSCVNTLELAVNGRPVERSAIRFVINGQERALDALADLTEETWFVQDHAVLRVMRQPPLRAGEEAKVDLKLGCFVPYILNGPASAFETMASMSRTMTAKQAAA